MNSQDLENREVVRQARSAIEGNRLQAGSTGALAIAPAPSGTVVDSDGNVRRVWCAGLPWDATTYFGSNQ